MVYEVCETLPSRECKTFHLWFGGRKDVWPQQRDIQRVSNLFSVC
jgi:hypothetical protein